MIITESSKTRVFLFEFPQLTRKANIKKENKINLKRLYFELTIK